MTRRRMIDSSIWDSEQVMKLTARQFKLYVFTISAADDEGRLRYSTEMVRARAFPFNGCSEDELAQDAQALVDVGLVTAYTDGKAKYLSHPNWKRYQTLRRPTESTYPAPEACEACRIHECSALCLQPAITECSSHVSNVQSQSGAVMFTKRREEKRREGNHVVASAADGGAEKRPVYHLIEGVFLEKNQDFAFKREGPHLKSIEAKCLARPDPEKFARAVLVAFWELVNGDDPIFKSQPFLPSILDSGGLWPRVLKYMDRRSKDMTTTDEVREAIKGAIG